MGKALAHAELTPVPAQQPSLAVVSDDVTLRARLVAAIADIGGLAVREEESLDDVLAAGETDVPDLLVLHRPVFSAADGKLVAKLREEHPELRIIVVLPPTALRPARRAADANVDGLVFDEQIESVLCPTLNAILVGQTALPRALKPGAQKPSLSFREKQILGMVVMGFTNGEIGGQLFLAESTVKSHLSSAFGKLGVRSRSEAATMILDPNGSLGTGILAITPDAERPRF